jgi:CubicO group peptidase (beta-lactamase class C family)
MNTNVNIDHGFCPKRLKNIDDYLQRIVDAGEVAGVGALVIRHGITAYRKSFGMQDRENSIPMKNDSIYRIYSMTKTFTVAAALTLYEKGFYKLHDPIKEFLPAFSEMKVAKHDERGVESLIPAERPITFHHLFTMTSGLPASLNITMNEVANRKAKSLGGWAGLTTAQIVDLAAETPLCFHPGESWLYGFSHDVLGRLIEVISGKTFGQYLKETIIDPLGLTDTAFYTPPEKQSRLCRVYEKTENSLRYIANLGSDKSINGNPERETPPLFESGGGGLTSTLDDLGIYAQALLNNGKFKNERILSRKTIELLRRDHVDRELTKKFINASSVGYGYGLGVRAMPDLRETGLNGSKTEWAWSGMAGTWYCVDPEEDLVSVFLIQRYPGGNHDLPKRFMQTVYGAIDD